MSDNKILRRLNQININERLSRETKKFDEEWEKVDKEKLKKELSEQPSEDKAEEPVESAPEPEKPYDPLRFHSAG